MSNLLTGSKFQNVPSFTLKNTQPVTFNVPSELTTTIFKRFILLSYDARPVQVVMTNTLTVIHRVFTNEWCSFKS